MMLFHVALALALAQQPSTVADLWRLVDAAKIAAPEKPGTPLPATGAIAVVAPVTLSCVALGANTFDLYFGTVNPPPLVQAAAVACRYLPAVAPGVKYFWKVTATNQKSATPSDVWSFTVAATPVAPVASVSGTTAPPATKILDAALVAWTITGSQYMKAGIATGAFGPMNAASLLFYQGTLYALGDDVPAKWYRWTGTGFAPYGRTPPVVTPTAQGFLNLTWNASTQTTVVSYELAWGGASGVYIARLIVPVAPTAGQQLATIPGLVPGTTVFIAVRAFDGMQFSAYSPEISGIVPATGVVTVPLVVPPAPQVPR